MNTTDADEQPFPSPGLFVAGEKCECFENAECCPSVADGMRWWRRIPSAPANGQRFPNVQMTPQPCVCKRTKDGAA